MGASRRPAQVLNKKLHDQIGIALRMYVKEAGSQHGSVQHKTTQLLHALHEDLAGKSEMRPVWKVCLQRSAVVKGAGLQQDISLPPGLEMLSVAASDLRAPEQDGCNLFSDAELDGRASEEEESVHTPRPSNTILAASAAQTPVKKRESERGDIPQCVDVAHAKTDACEDAMQTLSSVSVAHS